MRLCFNIASRATTEGTTVPWQTSLHEIVASKKPTKISITQLEGDLNVQVLEAFQDFGCLALDYLNLTRIVFNPSTSSCTEGFETLKGFWSLRKLRFTGSVSKTGWLSFNTFVAG